MKIIDFVAALNRLYIGAESGSDLELRAQTKRDQANNWAILLQKPKTKTRRAIKRAQNEE